LPRKKAAYKELRKSQTRHAKNIAIKSELKTLIKRFEKLISEKKTSEAKDFLKSLASKIDSAASKGIIHKKTASRSISRLMRRLSSSIKT